MSTHQGLYPLAAALAGLATVHAAPASAQVVDLPVIQVEAGRLVGGGSLTAPSLAQQRERLNRTAGSVGFVDAESYLNSYAANIRDTLVETPGVYVQNRYAQELRLSIRGSGIARAFHTRGIEILQDGVPTNLADGSGDFYQIDPLAMRSIEVFRGGNALPFGSSTLGGAVNFVSPTARTASAPQSLRVEGGSFGTFRLRGEVSHIAGPWDAFVGATFTRADGWRQHERQENGHVNGNVGYRFSERVETRFYFGAYLTDQKLPGSLTYSQAMSSPRMAAATALSGDQARNTYVQRIANVTTVRFDFGQLDIASWAVHKHLNHPIFQVLDQDGWTYGLSPRFTGTFAVAGLRNDVVAGARLFASNNAVQQFVNAGNAVRGAMTVNGRQVASNAEAWFENRLFVLPELALTAGAKAYSARRDYTAQGGLPGNPAAVDASVTYGGVNPRIGLLYEPLRNVQAFANLTRSADVPDFSDLTQTVGTTNAFVPLKAQSGWTAEVGTRGTYGRAQWDVTLFRSELRNQMLQFNTGPGIPASTFNAARTRLQGVELGASLDLVRDLTGNGDKLVLRQVWNYSDFRFAGDATYGNNVIPGVPRHVLRTSLAYVHPDFSLTPTLDIVPQGAFADYRNSFRVAGYAVLGVQATVRLPNGGQAFLDVRNLTDKRYISDIAPVVQYAPSTAAFYPGTGRSLYGGLRYQF